MPSFIVNQGIALSRRTRESLKQVGGLILRVDRDPAYVLDNARINGCVPILNMGGSALTQDLDPEATIWNPGELINLTRRPADFRNVVGELTPPPPESYPADFWVKAPGAAGRGKTFVHDGEAPGRLPRGWDIQRHIDGEEFRIISVGSKLVQGFRRMGDNNNRRYEWTGTAQAPRNVRKVVRMGIANIARIVDQNPETLPVVLGWDTIINRDGAWLLEVNTAPGLNQFTAQRIKNLIFNEEQGE